ncbi:hypothetical protein H9P43_007434 [Blastocladiella emersonii ATCC 22665]|nr:hypothetical protein H9P43_007434 [Blastocladiella emersonii ATCC 22665]
MQQYWPLRLAASLRATFAASGHAAKYLQLATLDTATTPPFPRVRTVVFRGLVQGPHVHLADALHSSAVPPIAADPLLPVYLLFVTDARAGKVAQLSSHQAAEACWYLGATRTQFRVSGTALVVGEDSKSEGPVDWPAVRRQVWAVQSPAARAGYAVGGPTPGSVVPPEGFAPASAPVGNEEEPSPHFALVALRAEAVDVLDLTLVPQTRDVWTW